MKRNGVSDIHNSIKYNNEIKKFCDVLSDTDVSEMVCISCLHETKMNT